MQMEGKKVKDPGIFREKKIDVCEGAPLRPCSILLTMNWL